MLRNTRAGQEKATNLLEKRRPTLVAVWGSAGSGKSMLAINLAFELTRLNQKVLLIDLDMCRPSVAAWLGLSDAGPGITAALRLARSSRLQVDEVFRLCAELKFGGSRVDILTGISSPKRWKEVRPEDIEVLVSVVSEHFDFILFDVSDELEIGLPGQDPDSRPTITRWMVETADLVLATFVADPVGVNRFLFDLSAVGRDIWPIANRVSIRSLGRSPSKQLRDTLAHFTAFPIRAELPSDWASCEASISHARPLMLESPNAKLTLAVRSLACEIVDECGARLNSEGGET